LLGSADEPGTQPAIGNRIVFERNALLELGSSEPLLIIGVTRGRLLHVRDTAKFLLGFALCFADDGITRDTESHGRQPATGAAFPQIGNFFSNALRRIAVHQIGVAFFGDELFGGGRLATGVQRRARLRDGLWLKNIVLDAIILP